MLSGKRFVVYTTATNAASKGYLTTLLPSIEATTKNHFVDKFYVLDGQSRDETKEKLLNISQANSKLEVLDSPLWDSSKWTWQILLDQYNFFLDHISKSVNETGEDTIVLYQGSDQVWTDLYANELKNACERMIYENCDYLLAPFRKTVNAHHVTSIYPYHSTGFTVYSALVVRPGVSYKIAGNEDILLCDKNLRRFFHKFANSSISYDMTFFTFEQIQNKISNHECGITRKEVHDYITNSFLRKCFSMGFSRIPLENHPLEMMRLVQDLNETMFGHSCFGHLGE